MTIASARQRILLAALLIRANRTVPIDELTDIVWNGAPPNGAVRTLRVYAMRLRRAVGPEIAARIQTRDPGYQCQVSGDELDVARFESLCRTGGAAARAGDWDAAATTLTDALALWRNDPLCDVGSQVLHDESVARLGQLRLQALDWRVDADLALGRHDQLVPELQAMVGEHPLREHGHAQLMLALYRCGRQAEALAAYQRARRILVDALGVEPGPPLRALHQQILAGDATLATPPARPRESTAPSALANPTKSVPRQVPAPTAHFTGRREALAVLTALADTTDGMVIAAIDGTAGIGKTTLALRWAAEHADRFPDGQLYVNLRGFDPLGGPTSPETALSGLLDGLGIDPVAVPSDVDAQAALYRTAMTGRRILVVLDNARDTAHVEALLPASPTAMVIVTSRDRLTGLLAAHGAHPVTLDLLDDAAGETLLARHVGVARLAAEPGATAEILHACAGLPLAIAIAAGRAVTHPNFPLTVLADELRAESTRLRALDAGDPQASTHAVFSCSYRALEPDQATVFALLGLAPGPEIGLAAAASLTGLPRVDSVLRTLERVSMLEQHQPRRFRMHDLIRLYAAEQAEGDVSADDRAAARRRVLDHYLHTAHAGDELLSPHQDPIDIGAPVDGCVPERLTDRAAAVAWFDREHACLLAAQEMALATGAYRQVWQLAFTLHTFHRRRGLVHGEITCWRAALTAAEQLVDANAIAQAQRLLGHALATSGRYAEAFPRLERALALAEQTNDLLEQARVHGSLSWAYDLVGDFDVSREHADHALRLYQQRDDKQGEAMALNGIGWMLAKSGELEAARAYCEPALDLARQVHDYNTEVGTLDSLGYIAHHTGQHDKALGYYNAGLALAREVGHAAQEASTLEKLGAMHAALGDPGQARDAWQQALRLYTAQHRSADVTRVRAAIADLDR